MSPRKEAMKILRRDGAFSAALVATPRDIDEAAAPASRPVSGEHMGAQTSEVGLAAASAPDADSATFDGLGYDHGPLIVRPENPAPRSSKIDPTAVKALVDPSRQTNKQSGRGKVVYVSVALTEAQVPVAEKWAAVAKCSVPFLMRKVVSSVRADFFDEWRRSGLSRIERPLNPGKFYRTSVTLTLPVDLASALSANYDPLGINGLGRVLGADVRERFSSEFHRAATAAGYE